jgi:mannitol/fructose-specific phosphotransferase system IIA component (Ntr-type)
VRKAAPHSSVQAELLAGVLAREASFPTMLGDGVALPHVRTPLVNTVLMSACVLEEPVEFGATEGHSVDVLFLLLSPTHAPSEHLTLLRALTRLVADADVLFALRHAPSPTEFVALVHASMTS